MMSGADDRMAPRVSLDTVPDPIHFMGIGGAGMYALAELFLRRGRRVTGCDLKESTAVRRLRGLGAEVSIGHDAAHVQGAGAVVMTAAVPADHPELVAARAEGIPVWKRAEALGAVVNKGRVVAVAGTHGKTSTTALTVGVRATAGMDPTGFVGGRVAAWDGNLRPGGDLFVVEADEYDRSFHQLEPDLAVVTNLEADHLDIYGSLEGVRDAFMTFLNGLRPDGRAIVCADDPGAASLLPELGSTGYSYGTSAGSNLRALEIEYGPEGTSFRVQEDENDCGTAQLSLPGRHSLLNALAAGAVARQLGATWESIRAGWAGARGVERRFERLGEVDGVLVIDDYAHHPTEITATLATARAAFPGRRVVAAFQPHLYSRTRDFAREFGGSLAQADEVWLTAIFPAREQPIDGVTHSLITDSIRAAGGVVREHPDLDTLAAAMDEGVRSGDVVILMGAGSIERVGAELVGLLRGRVHA